MKKSTVAIFLITILFCLYFSKEISWPTILAVLLILCWIKNEALFFSFFGKHAKSDTKYLHGPNSHITTIAVRLKLDRLHEKILKNVEGYKGFPGEVLEGWETRIFEDEVSGMIYRLIDYYYGGERPSKVSSVSAADREFKFMAKLAGEDSEVAWQNRHLYVQEDWRSLKIGIGANGGDVNEDTALCVLDTYQIFRQLKRMDKIACGAALKRPLKNFEKNKSSGLDYDFNHNPIDGSHIFENDFVTVKIQRQAFEGAFTLSPSYDEISEHDFDKAFYGTSKFEDNAKN